MIISIVILFALAGFFNYIMDNIQFRGVTKYENIWRNKWKNGDRNQSEAFPFSSTVLVFLTDRWHFAKWLMFMCFEASVSILALAHYNLSYWWIPAAVLILKSIRGGVFSIFFK